MSRHPYNAASLLEQLHRNGPAIDDKGLADFIIKRQRERDLPLYLKCLFTVGTLLTVFYLLTFLKEKNIESDTVCIIGGLIAIAAAMGLERIAGPDNTARKYGFLMLSSLSLMLMGKPLFTIGIDHMLDTEWSLALGLLTITVVSYPLYRVPIDRFLSSFATLLCILLVILEDQVFSGSRVWLLNGFFLFQLAGIATLLTHAKTEQGTIPLRYALIYSLCIIVLSLSLGMQYAGLEGRESIHPAFINMLLVGGLIALFGWAAGNMGRLKTKPLVIASLGAVLLGLISAPGILLTIGLMVLGYAKQEKPLTGLGILLMPVFLFLYYYNLDVSLLQKSGLLIGSGVILLAGRFYLRHKGWYTRGTACAQK